MAKDIVKFELAFLAKIKGFKMEVDSSYSEEERLRKHHSPYFNYNDTRDRISAPIQSELQEWLIDDHDIHVEVKRDIMLTDNYSFIVFDSKQKFNSSIHPLHSYRYKSRREALHLGLMKGLGMVKYQ